MTMKIIKSIPVLMLVVTMLAFIPVEKADHNHNKDIVELAAETETLSTLFAAVEAAGLVEILQSEGPFTVFAPTNEAFAALPEGTLESLLLEENREMLVEILTYHVVPGKVMSTDLEDNMYAETVQGNSVSVSVANYGVRVDDASVTQADIEASNGVIHVISAVILPPQDETDSRY